MVTILVEFSNCILVNWRVSFIQIVVDVVKFMSLILSVPFSNSRDWIMRSTHKTKLRLRWSEKCLKTFSDQDIQLQDWDVALFQTRYLSPPLDNTRVMVIVWRLRGNIIRTAPCWVVWHNVHSQQHTHVSSFYRSSRLGLSNWDPYAMHRGGCLEVYYCNMVEWSWWDSSLIWKTNWLPSVLWHCWFGHMTCKNRPRYDL